MLCWLCQRASLQRRLCAVIFSEVSSPRSYVSALDIPVPRLKEPTIQKNGVRIVEGVNQSVRVAPWGPRPERNLSVPQSLTRYELSETIDIPSTNKARQGRLEVTSDQFQRVGRVLKRYGIDNAEIEQNPGIFTVPPEDLEDCLELFKECGWEMFTTDMVIYCWVLLSKLSAKDVIISDSFSVTRSVLRNLMTELGLEDSVQQDTLNIVTESSAAYLTLADLRILAVRQYLRSIYSNPEDIQKIFKWIMRNSGPFRPIKSVQRQFQYIFEEFKITPERLLKYPSILTKTERSFAELVQHYPKFYGLDLRVMAMQNPTVLSPTVERFAKMEPVLRNFDISPYQVSRHLGVLSLCAETVERRLIAIQKDPGLYKYKDEPDFLALVYHHGDVMRRLSFLRSMKVTDFGLPLLICVRYRFYVALNRGSFQKEDEKRTRNRLFLPVAAWLRIPTDKIRKMLRQQLKFPIPPYTAINHEDMQRVVDCFIANGITKDHFLNCMSLCLYPSHVVEKYLAEVLSDPSLVVRKEQANFLHYVLYAIEKQTNFGGPQAWGPVDAVTDEIDETDDGHQLMGVRSILSQNLPLRLAEVDSAGEAAQKTDLKEKKENWFD